MLRRQVLVSLADVLEGMGRRVQELDVGGEVLVTPVPMLNMDLGFTRKQISIYPPELGDLVEGLLGNFSKVQLVVSCSMAKYLLVIRDSFALWLSWEVHLLSTSHSRVSRKPSTRFHRRASWRRTSHCRREDHLARTLISPAISRLCLPGLRTGIDQKQVNAHAVGLALHVAREGHDIAPVGAIVGFLEVTLQPAMGIGLRKIAKKKKAGISQ